MPELYDIAIIGAGAAGLAAAIFAGEAAPGKVVLLDGAKSVGAKILVSGGTRCNITHDHIEPADYNAPRNIVRNILAAFDEQAAARWFESMGVALKREETGKLFPVSNSAKAVLAALLRRCDQLGVRLLSDHRVSQILPNPDGFTIEHSQGQLRARRIILATGGQSLPRTGSDGQAYSIARSLGHTVTPTYPALVPLVLDSSFFHAAISGLSLEVELRTFLNGKLTDRRTGSLLWTHFGISGPVVMDASRHWVIAKAQALPAELRCSLLPGQSFEHVERQFLDAASRAPKRPLKSFMSQLLIGRLADTLTQFCNIDPDILLAQLPREPRRQLVHALTDLRLPVAQDRGWNYAEVTAGGVPLPEIDYRTMQSRIRPNLFLAGEILDCDGRIGGFNFQWAWATGHLAGRAAAKV